MLRELDEINAQVMGILGSNRSADHISVGTKVHANT